MVDAQADNDPIQVQWPYQWTLATAPPLLHTHCDWWLPCWRFKCISRWYADWLAAGLGTDDVITQITPSEFTLAQNFPNPFNPSTSITFALDRNADINLSIYNMLGQKVKTLAKGSRNAGTHTLQWNGLDDAGQSVSTGIYLYKLTSGSKSITRKWRL